MERAGDDLAAAVANALRWWADAGVDAMVDEAPRDWLRAKNSADANTRSSRAQSRGVSAEVALSPPPLDFARDERGRTEPPLPGQLNLFQAYLRNHPALPFAGPAARRVCPAGDPAAGLMLMTDMPGQEDCGANSLISGEAGRLFDRMLAAIGRDRNSIYLASVSCLRSPSGQLAGEAAQQCATLARHHVGLAAPKALLLLGDTAGRALLGLTVIQGRGRWHSLDTHAGPVPTLLSFAPSFLLTQPTAKALAWADLQMLMEGLS